MTVRITSGEFILRACRIIDAEFLTVKTLDIVERERLFADLLMQYEAGVNSVRAARFAATRLLNSFNAW